MARTINLWKAQEQELTRLRRLLPEFIARNNVLNRERDEARKEAKRLIEILRDIAFAEEGKAREAARKALARIERKAEKAGAVREAEGRC